MTVTNYNDLRGQFFQNSTEKRPAPYWTLYAAGIGAKDTIIHRNEVVDNLENSFGLLAETIRRVNNPQGTVFRVFQTDRPAGNVAVSEYRVQIFDAVTNPQAAAAAHTAGIGSVAVGYLSKEEFDREKTIWNLERKVEDLEARENNFIGKIPEILDSIMKSPIGAVVMAKLMGVPLATPANVAVNGTPQSDDYESPDDATDDDRINNAIDEIEDSTGLDATQLLEKIAKVARHNPDFIKNIASQI